MKKYFLLIAIIPGILVQNSFAASNEELLREALADKRAYVAEMEKALDQAKIKNDGGTILTVGLAALTFLLGAQAVKKFGLSPMGPSLGKQLQKPASYAGAAVLSAGGAVVTAKLSKAQLKHAEKKLAEAKENLSKFESSLNDADSAR